jgi:hypothetical protein
VRGTSRTSKCGSGTTRTPKTIAAKPVKIDEEEEDKSLEDRLRRVKIGK